MHDVERAGTLLWLQVGCDVALKENGKAGHEVWEWLARQFEMSNVVK